MADLTPLVSIGAAIVFAAYQTFFNRPKPTSPGDDPYVVPEIPVETLARDLATQATAPGTPQDQRLAAGVAALAVAQLKPAPPESKLKTYIWPIVLALIGIVGSVVPRLVDHEPVDCSAYLESVETLHTLTPDRARLAELAAGMRPDKEFRTRCGGTPTDILRAAGYID